MSKPRRIVSLVPSTTETLFRLGASERVVGVTRFCVHPKEARERARIIGGTKDPRIEVILTLEPDLVLANQEENRREDVERLRERVPVSLFFPRDVEGAVADIRSLGRLLGEPEAAEALADEIDRERTRMRGVQWKETRYLYFIWRRPYMVAGPETFIEALLAECGFRNAAPRDRGRYPEIGIEEIETSGAEVLLLASEPFPFEEKHLAEFGNAAAYLVDGELLSWHGARLLQGLPYLLSFAERMATSRSPSARPYPGPSP